MVITGERMGHGPLIYVVDIYINEEFLKYLRLELVLATTKQCNAIGGI